MNDIRGMNGVRERRRKRTIGRADARKLDELLRGAQAGILAKITGALDLQAGLGAITGSITGMVGPPPGSGTGFEVGGRVTITGGPFADLPATVSQVNHAARMLTVLITVFGRQTRADVTFDQVVSTDDIG